VENFYLDTETIQNNVRQAYKQFHQLKTNPDHRNTWIARIIQAWAKAQGKSTKSLWKQHHLAEHAQKMAWLVCTALQPSNCSGVLMMVIGPTRDGRQEFHMRYLLEKACLEEAGHWFSQANLTPLLLPYTRVWCNNG